MRKIAITALLSLLAVSVVFAGGQKDDASGKDAPKVIKIGMSAPITGNYAEYGKTFTVGSKIAIDAVNAKGGINGKLVEMTIMDSKGDPKEASEIAKKFGQNKEILAVIGDFTSSSCMAAAPIYGENTLSLVSPSASHPDFAGMNDYMYSVAGRQDGEAPFLAEFLAQKYLKSKAAAVVYVNNDWGLTAKDHFMKRAEKVNLKVVAVEPFMAGERDYNSMITKIRQSNPDSITVISQAADAALVIKQIRQAGWDVKIGISGGAYSPQLVTLGGKEIEGSYIDAPFVVSEKDVKGIEFVKEFEKRAGYTAPAHAQYSHDATMLVLEAIGRADKAGTLNRMAVQKEITATKDFPGYSGPITFNPAGDVNKKYVIMQIVNGQFKQLTDYSYMDK